MASFSIMIIMMINIKPHQHQYHHKWKLSSQSSSALLAKAAGYQLDALTTELKFLQRKVDLPPDVNVMKCILRPPPQCKCNVVYIIHVWSFPYLSFAPHRVHFVISLHSPIFFNILLHLLLALLATQPPHQSPTNSPFILKSVNNFFSGIFSPPAFRWMEQNFNGWTFSLGDISVSVGMEKFTIPLPRIMIMILPLLDDIWIWMMMIHDAWRWLFRAIWSIRDFCNSHGHCLIL